MASATLKDKAASSDQDEAAKANAKLQEVHEEGQKQSGASKFDSYEDAYADYQKKAQKLAEAVQEANAAEQALPEIRRQLEQKRIDELKAKDPAYTDDGRVIGIDGVSPASLTNPDPATLRGVS